VLWLMVPFMILTDKSELGDFRRSFLFCKLKEEEGEGGGGGWKVVCPVWYQ
jgi:hypothetical protein